MSGRFQPTNGADSPEGRRPYLVHLEDRFDEHDRITVRVPAAYGPKDARNQAEFENPGYIGMSAEEVLIEASLDYQDAEHDKGRAA